MKVLVTLSLVFLLVAASSAIAANQSPPLLPNIKAEDLPDKTPSYPRKDLDGPLFDQKPRHPNQTYTTLVWALKEIKSQRDTLKIGGMVMVAMAIIILLLLGTLILKSNRLKRMKKQPASPCPPPAINKPGGFRLFFFLSAGIFSVGISVFTFILCYYIIDHDWRNDNVVALVPLIAFAAAFGSLGVLSLRKHRSDTSKK